MNPLGILIPMDRRQALAHHVTIPDRVNGAALFADISGFTPLTAALAAELGRQQGVGVHMTGPNPTLPHDQNGNDQSGRERGREQWENHPGRIHDMS